MHEHAAVWKDGQPDGLLLFIKFLQKRALEQERVAFK